VRGRYDEFALHWAAKTGKRGLVDYLVSQGVTMVGREPFEIVGGEGEPKAES
jgi:hypothetical protein